MSAGIIKRLGVHWNHRPAHTDPYPFDLVALQLGRPVIPHPIPAQLTCRTSPLQWQEWDRALVGHSDRRFARYVVDGIHHGFRIGFRYVAHSCSSTRRNISSALEHFEVICAHLAGECTAGRVLGPLPPSLLGDIHTSPLGVVPKKGLNKWRLILDLSSPEGHSVNDGIPSVLCSLSYISVDDATRAVLRAGRGALLAKVDIKIAYRIVEVHPEDRALHGMQFDSLTFVDSVLPFGLRSAPKIFTAIAEALEWISHQAGAETVLHIHYLDDFLIVGRPASNQCGEDLHRLLGVFAHLRVPLAMEKLEGPVTRLTFLGIEIDTDHMVLRLPQEKLTELRAILAQWHAWR